MGIHVQICMRHVPNPNSLSLSLHLWKSYASQAIIKDGQTCFRVESYAIITLYCNDYTVARLLTLLYVNV